MPPVPHLNRAVKGIQGSWSALAWLDGIVSADQPGVNLQAEVLEQPGLIMLDGDCADHGVVGAESQGGNVSCTPRAAASSCNRVRKRALAATPPPTQSFRSPCCAGRRTSCPTRYRPPPPENWPPGRQPVRGKRDQRHVRPPGAGNPVADGRFQSAEAEVETTRRPGKTAASEAADAAVGRLLDRQARRGRTGPA